MANVYAVKSGNWSDTTLWNTSALPTTVDDVYANAFAIYIDQNINVLSLRTTASAPIVAGGGFILNHNIIARANDVYAGTTTAVTFASASPFFSTFVGSASGSPTTSFRYGVINASTGTLTLCGDYYSTTVAAIDRSYGAVNNSTGIMNVYGRGIGTTGTNQPAGLLNVSTGILNVYGDILGSTSTTFSYGCHTAGGTTNIVGNIISRVSPALKNTASTAVINITGNVLANNSRGIWNEIVPSRLTVVGLVTGGTSGNAFGIDLQSGICTVNIVGNVLGGIGATAYGIYSQGANSITISGNVVGGVGSGAYGAVNNATGYMEVNGIAIGNGWGLGSAGIGGAAPGIFGSQTGTTIIRGLSCGARGQWPTAGNVFIIPQSTSTATLETSAFQDVVLFTSLSTNIAPPASSVRLGTKYNLNDYTGTCAIPSVSSVLQGVAVDNSVGIAALQPQTIWNYSVLSATDVDSLGGRLKEVATVQSVGQQLTALN